MSFCTITHLYSFPLVLSSLTQFDFKYDAAGNIVQEINQVETMPILPNSVEMTYTSANRLATYNGQAVSFDKDGNLLTAPLKGQMTNLSFDSRNRLIQAGNTTYRYDAENQRVAVNQTRFVINSQPALSQVLIKTEVDGTKTFYVYGLGLIGEETNGQYRAYLFDFRRSTVALTDGSGQIIQRFQYSAYGELVSGDATQTPFLFNGMYGVMTDGSGLYYMRARYYSPEIKRFVNQDVLLGEVSDGQSLNRFAFVTGQPVSLVDPFGLVTAVIYNGPISSNPFGHVAIAVTGSGIYSFGGTIDGPTLGSDIIKYSVRAAKDRDSEVVIIKTTPEQDRKILEQLQKYRDPTKDKANDIGLGTNLIGNNCATRTNEALAAAGLTHEQYLNYVFWKYGLNFELNSNITPANTLLMAKMFQEKFGGTIIKIPQGTTIIPAILELFNGH